MNETTTADAVTTETPAEETELAFRGYMDLDIAAGDDKADPPYPRAKAYTKAAAAALLEREGVTGTFMMAVAMWLEVVRHIVSVHPLRLPTAGATVPPEPVVSGMIEVLKTVDPQLQRVKSPKEWYDTDAMAGEMIATPTEELEKLSTALVDKHGMAAAILFVGAILAHISDRSSQFKSPIAKMLILRVMENLKTPLEQLTTLVTKFTTEDNNARK